MTAAQFRATHGDPTTWDPGDYETYEVLADIDDLEAALNILPQRAPAAPALNRQRPEGHRSL